MLKIVSLSFISGYVTLEMLMILIGMEKTYEKRKQ